MQPLKDAALFLGKFLRYGTKIASISPSSKWLSRAAMSGVPWKEISVIVELGAGTGPLTQAIADRIEGQTRAIIIERDPDFVRVLRRRFGGDSRLEIVEGDALDFKRILRERSIVSIDFMISGLPVPSFSRADQERYFADLREVLKPGGGYNQLTEFPLVYLPFYRRHFEKVRFVFEPRNIPPAGMYICSGPKA